MTNVKPFRDDLGWRWQMTAGRHLLVTDGGGAQVVLAGAHHAPFMTRDPETGLLRPLDQSDLVARIIANAPDVRRAAQDLINGVRIGLVSIEGTEHGTLSNLTNVMQRLVEAVERSGQ